MGVKVAVPEVSPADITISEIVFISPPPSETPLTSILTVTLAVVAVESVAVRVIVSPEFSAIVLALAVNVTVGADSLSDIVMVSCCVPFSVAPPPDTPDISRIAVSLPS